MSIVLKLQSSLLIWKLSKWDSPSLHCHLYTGSFICSLDLLPRRMKRAEAKVPPRDVSCLHCKWLKMPSCPCNWLQRALIKLTQGVLKWGTCAVPRGLLLTHTAAATVAQQFAQRCSSVNLTCSHDLCSGHESLTPLSRLEMQLWGGR